MLVHTVFFWLKPELTEEERRLPRGRGILKGISAVEAVYIGTPAPTDRPSSTAATTWGSPC